MSFFKRERIIEVEVKVEKTVTETILGTPVKVDLYASIKTGWESCIWFSIPYEKVVGYYHTCEQAMDANPDLPVKKRTLWRVGDIYLSSLKVERVNVSPKPKVEKGKKVTP